MPQPSFPPLKKPAASTTAGADQARRWIEGLLKTQPGLSYEQVKQQFTRQFPDVEESVLSNLATELNIPLKGTQPEQVVGFQVTAPTDVPQIPQGIQYWQNLAKEVEARAQQLTTQGLWGKPFKPLTEQEVQGILQQEFPGFFDPNKNPLLGAPVSQTTGTGAGPATPYLLPPSEVPQYGQQIKDFTTFTERDIGPLISPVQGEQLAADIQSAVELGFPVPVEHHTVSSRFPKVEDDEEYKPRYEGAPWGESPSQERLQLQPSATRHEILAINEFERARDYALQHGMPIPQAGDNWKQRWDQQAEWYPSYKLTPEQHDILRGARPITEWNAEAALHAGVPPNIIRHCIDAGGINVRVAGWSPGAVGLGQHYRNMDIYFQNKPEFIAAGVTPQAMSRLLYADYHSRQLAGLLDIPAREHPDSMITEENGRLYRISGTWRVNALGEEEFTPDNKIKVPVLPVTDNDFTNYTTAMMTPLEELAGLDKKPQLPEGYRYGELTNSIIAPDGQVLFYEDEEAFEKELQKMGVMPTWDISLPTARVTFMSFNELMEHEADGNITKVLSGLNQLIELGAISVDDRQDYIDGKKTLEDLDNQTLNDFHNPWGEIAYLPPENLEEIWKEATAEPGAFMALIEEEGRSPKMDALLRWLGATDEQLEEIFPGQPKPPTTLDELEQGFEAVDVATLGDKVKLMDASGQKDEVAHVLREAGVPIESVEAYLRGEMSAQEAAMTDEKINKGMGFFQRWEDIDKWWAAYAMAETLKRKEYVEQAGYDIRKLSYEELDRILEGYSKEGVPIEQQAPYKGVNYLDPLAIRARYDTWEGVWGAKFAAEAINPMYLIPIGGALSKILKGLAMGAGSVKMTKIAGWLAKGAEKAPKTIRTADDIIAAPVTYSLKKVSSVTLKPAFKAIAKKFPGAKKEIIPLPETGNWEDMLAWVEEYYKGRIRGNVVEKAVKKAKLVFAAGQERADNAVTLVREQMQGIGNIEDMLKFTDEGVITKYDGIHVRETPTMRTRELPPGRGLAERAPDSEVVTKQLEGLRVEMESQVEALHASGYSKDHIQNIEAAYSKLMGDLAERRMPIYDDVRLDEIRQRLIEAAQKVEVDGENLEYFHKRWFDFSDNEDLQLIGRTAQKNKDYLKEIHRILYEEYPSGYIELHRGKGQAGEMALEREFTNSTSSLETARTFEDTWSPSPSINNVVIRVEDVVSIGAVEESELIVPSKVIKEAIERAEKQPIIVRKSNDAALVSTYWDAFATKEKLSVFKTEAGLFWRREIEDISTILRELAKDSPDVGTVINKINSLRESFDLLPGSMKLPDDELHILNDMYDTVARMPSRSEATKSIRDILEDISVQHIERLDRRIDVLESAVLGRKSGFVEEAVDTATPDNLKDLFYTRQLSHGTLFQNYKHFDLDQQLQEYIETAHLFINQAADIAEEAGIHIPRRELFDTFAEYFPRRVVGKEGVSPGTLAGEVAPASKLIFKSSPEKQRIFDMMEEGIKAGFKYSSPLDAISAYVSGIYRRVGGVESMELLKPYFKIPGSETMEGQMVQWAALTAKKQTDAAKRLVQVIGSVARGESPAGATLAAIRKDTPEIAAQLDSVLNLRKSELIKTVRALSAEFKSRMGASTDEFLKNIYDARGGRAITSKDPLTSEELRNALSLLKKDQKTVSKMLKEIYENAYKHKSKKQKEFLNKLKVEAEDILSERKVGEAVAKDERQRVMAFLNHIGFTEALSPEAGYRIFADTGIVHKGKMITGRDLEKMVKKQFAQEAGKWVEGLSNVARGFVSVQASMDVSAPMIQGFLTLGFDFQNLLGWLARREGARPTCIWAKTFANHVGAMISPNVHRRFMVNHRGTYQWVADKGFIMGQPATEFVSAIPKLEKGIEKIPGRVESAISRVPGVGEPIGKVTGKVLGVPAKSLEWFIKNTFGRTSYGFSAWGEEARILGIEAMRDMWVRKGRNPRELIEFWNRATGVVSTRAMGVSARQRAIESATLFAPRFIRAMLLIIGDLFSRGARASEMRKTFGASLMAWALAYASICMMLGQKPNFNPFPQEYGGDGSHFMKVNVGDEKNAWWVGLSGFPSLMRHMFNIFAYATMEPDKLVRFDESAMKTDFINEIKSMPLIRPLFSKASPSINLITELISGRDFLGRRLEEGEDWLQVVGEKFLPIATQSMVFEEQPLTLPIAAAEILGLITYPQSEYEKANAKTDNIIMALPDEFLDERQLEMREDGDLHFHDLDRAQRDQILRDYPQIREIWEVADAESERYDTTAWVLYKEAMRSTELDENGQPKGITPWLTSQKQAFADRMREGNPDFMMHNMTDEWGSAGKIAYGMRMQLEKEPYFQSVMASMERSRVEKMETGELTTFERAYQQYWDWVMSDTDLKPGASASERAEVRSKRRRKWEETWGPTTVDKFWQLMESQYKGEDPLVFKWAQDSRQLDDTYFDLVDEYGDPDHKARREWRAENPDGEAILAFWGMVSTFESEGAEQIVREWMDEYNVPERALKVFQDLYPPEEALQKFNVTEQMWEDWLKVGQEFENTYNADAKKAFVQQQFLREHPELNMYFVENEIRSDARTTKWKVPPPDNWVKVYNNIYEQLDRNERSSFRANHWEFDYIGFRLGFWKRHKAHEGKPPPDVPITAFEDTSYPQWDLEDRGLTK